MEWYSGTYSFLDLTLFLVFLACAEVKEPQCVAP